MIANLEISGIHYEISEDLLKYVTKKIGGLDKYVERHAREALRAEVKMRETKSKDKKQCHFEVIMHLKHEKLTVKEATINMFAAVDIVESKLKNQLARKKKRHLRSSVRGIRGFVKRLRTPHAEPQLVLDEE
jgi:ribosomal subunit interface protein